MASMPFRAYLHGRFCQLFWRSLVLCLSISAAFVIAFNIRRAGSLWWQGIFTRPLPDMIMMAVALLGIVAAGLELAIMTAYFRWRRGQLS